MRYASAAVLWFAATRKSEITVVTSSGTLCRFYCHARIMFRDRRDQKIGFPRPRCCGALLMRFFIVIPVVFLCDNFLFPVMLCFIFKFYCTWNRVELMCTVLYFLISRKYVFKFSVSTYNLFKNVFILLHKISRIIYKLNNVYLSHCYVCTQWL